MVQIDNASVEYLFNFSWSFNIVEKKANKTIYLKKTYLYKKELKDPSYFSLCEMSARKAEYFWDIATPWRKMNCEASSIFKPSTIKFRGITVGLCKFSPNVFQRFNCNFSPKVSSHFNLAALCSLKDSLQA